MHSTTTRSYQETIDITASCRYEDSADTGNTIEENSSVFSLIRMR